MKKWISGLLALLLTLSLCAGCGEKAPDGNSPDGSQSASLYYDITGIDPAESVMEVDGNQIPAELYFYWVAYQCSYLEYNIGMYNAYYGLYGDLLDEEGNVLWDASFSEGVSVAQSALDAAEQRVMFYAVIENAAAARGITLTEEDEAAIDEYFNEAAEQAGGEEAFLENLELMGITRETFRRITASSSLYDHLLELVEDETSDLYLPPENYRQYGAYADHILLMTQDPTTREALSEEEIAAKRQTAEDLLSQLRAAEDPEALFAQLADEYSEDTGRASNPDGYVFGKGEMVPAFEEAAFALEPGQISDIVESDYGFHIILGKDLLSKLEEEPEQKTALAGDYLSERLAEDMESAEVTRTEAITGLDVADFYAKYTEIVEARQAAKEAEQGAGEDGSDAAPEDGGTTPENGGTTPEDGGSAPEDGDAGSDSNGGAAE